MLMLMLMLMRRAATTHDQADERVGYTACMPVNTFTALHAAALTIRAPDLQVVPQRL